MKRARGRPMIGATKRKTWRAYTSWQAMLYRCTNPQSDCYRHYGGRGIKVCERWTSFENFLADMGERPIGMTLERKDNDRNYEPSNCRWATRREQNLNTRAVRRVTYNGETRALVEFAEDSGIAFDTVRGRLRLGWTLQRALTTPVRNYSNG